MFLGTWPVQDSFVKLPSHTAKAMCGGKACREPLGAAVQRGLTPPLAAPLSHVWFQAML